MESNLNIDKVLQNVVGQAIIQQKSHVILNNETKHKDVRTDIRVFMRRHPEVFWFSHQYYFDESTAILYLKYNFIPKKKDFYTKEIDNATRCLFQLERLKNLSDIEKVAYVPNEPETIDSKVKEIDPKALKKEYKPFGFPVNNGDKLTVQLDLSYGVQKYNKVCGMAKSSINLSTVSLSRSTTSY